MITPPKKVKSVPKKDIQKHIGPARQKIKDYQNRTIELAALYFTPLSMDKRKDKKKCSICDRPMLSENYWKNFSFINVGRVDETGKMCTPVCKTCAQKLFDYYYKEVDKDLTKAMEHLCCDLNIYWDLEIFKAAKDLYEKKLEAPFIPQQGDNFDQKYCGNDNKIDQETKIRYEKLTVS